MKVFLDRVVNLLEEGLDVGIRIGELPDSSIRAIPVGSIRRIVCASSAYLAKYGILKHPSELAGHVVVAATPMPEWKCSHQISVRVKSRLVVTNNDAAIEAILEDVGITRLMSYQVAAHLSSGILQTALHEYEPAPLPIHGIYREGRNASAKVRTFVDLMVNQLRSNKALNNGF